MAGGSESFLNNRDRYNQGEVDTLSRTDLVGCMVARSRSINSGLLTWVFQADENANRISERVRAARTAMDGRMGTGDVWATIDPKIARDIWPGVIGLFNKLRGDDFSPQVKKLLVLKGKGVGNVAYKKELGKAHLGEMKREQLEDDDVSSAILTSAGTRGDELVLMPLVRGSYAIRVLTPTFTGPEAELTGNVEQICWVSWGWALDAKSQTIQPQIRVRGMVDVVWSEESRQKYGSVVDSISSSMMRAHRKTFEEMDNPLPGGAPGFGEKS